MRLAKPSPHPRALLAFVLGAAVGLAGCFSLAEHPAPPLLSIGEPDAYGVRRLHHEVIAEGGSSPLGNVALAVHEWDAWTALKQHLRIDWDAEPDLDRSTVIYAAVSASVDYRLRVDSVYVEGGLLSERSRHTELVGGNIVVAYTIERVGDGCFSRPAFGTPYQVIAVGVTFDQEVLFTEVYEEVACEPRGR